MVVKVLSLNVFTPVLGADRKEERLLQLVDFLTKNNTYDVLMLQEFFQFSIFGIELFGFREWMKERMLPLGFWYFAESPTPPFGQTSGLLVCSKHPLTHIMGAPYKGWKSWSGIEAWTWKGTVMARVCIPHLPPLMLCDTHLQCGAGRTWVEAQRVQLTQLRQRLGDKEDVVVAGDFNIDALGRTRHPGQFEFLKETLAPIVDPLDNPAINPDDLVTSNIYKLDYIMQYRPSQWRVVEGSARTFAIGSGIGNTGMSDHKAVETSFEPIETA